MDNSIDLVRRAQGDFLAATGFGPRECPYRVIASATHWRLRNYGGDASRRPPLLIIAAPIKRPYLWDLTPPVSAVRMCLRHGLQVYLLEWIAPEGDAITPGLDQYAAAAISECVARIASEPQGRKPVLIGHSLGGTFAAIHAAASPRHLGGLVLLGAPLCFEKESSAFRDAVVALAPRRLSETKILPGWVLSEFCALASPDVFLWSRLADFALSLNDPWALEMHVRIERWALDEVPLSGRLVDEVLQWLYRENRFCRGCLPIAGRLVGPATIEVPTLAVVTTTDDVAPMASIAPFVEEMANTDVCLIEYPGESGVGLQHLGILAGRDAFATVWPKITAWIDALAGDDTDHPSRT